MFLGDISKEYLVSLATISFLLSFLNVFNSLILFASASKLFV